MSRNQLSVIRKMVIFFLCMGQPIALHAKDHGIHGIIAPISEEDPLVLIQSKLKGMEEQGELERHNIELQKKTKAAVERPKPVEGVTRLAPSSQRGTTESRVFYYDPSYVVKNDLKDHTGRVFHKEGTKVNPLETVNLSQELLFFDSDDEKQKVWVLEKLKQTKAKLILIKGAPLSLSEEWNMPVYFDQGGALTTKLSIKHVPAFVSQTGLLLRIEEINLEQNIQKKVIEGKSL